MTISLRSAGFGLILLGALAGCQTTGAAPQAARDGYAGSGFSDGLSGRAWSCGEAGRDCGGSPEDQTAYQDGWIRGWTQRCERSTTVATLRSCEEVLGGDWTSAAVSQQRQNSRGGRGGGGRSGR